MSTAPRSETAGGGGDGTLQAPAVKAGETVGAFEPRALGRKVLGLVIISACFFAGDFTKRRLGLILPGSVLGLFLLLGLMGAKIVRYEWVDQASRLLIFVLPVCFVTLYVVAGNERELWREWGVVIAGTLTLTLVLLWIFTGWLAQRLLKGVSQ